MMWRGVSALALGVVAVGCGGLHGPAPDAKEHVRGEHYRLVGASMHQDRPGKGWAICGQSSGKAGESDKKEGQKFR